MTTRRSTLHRTALTLSLAVLALALWPGSASAQYFGRNKVQWENFDWRVLKTEHFDIYHYPEEEKAVRDTARMAERWYDRLTSVFQREFFERKSIVLYADHSDFQQTTVVRGLIGQGTGGVTEGLKTRVVLPLTGNYEDTDHVLGHELVHVFQYDILKDPLNQDPGNQGVRQSAVDIPLWFIEGLAEYLSLGHESPQTAMWLRDALARDELPTVKQLSRDPRLFPYRWGHAFWAYVGGRWGDAAVGQLFTRGVQVGLEGAMAEVLGLSPEDFSEAWRGSIRQAYTPVLERRQPPSAAGTRLFPRDEDSTDLYIAPVLSPDGSEVIFLSTRRLFTFDLYLADARTGEIKSKLVSEDADPHIDSLRFLDSAGAWSPDGRKFAFIVFSRGDNELAVLDVRSRKIERRYQIDEVGAMWNPAWSPDGRSIVISGSAGGITDLYQVDVDSGRVRRLTNDVYADLQPEWAPDGRSLVFVSDRRAGAEVGALTRSPMGIWRLDLASGRVSELVRAEGNMERGNRFNPHFGPGGRDLYFLSEAAGVSDLYRMTVESGEIFRVTRVTTGVTGIARMSPALTVAERTGRVMFSVFNDTRYQINSLEPQQARGEAVVAEVAQGEAAEAALLPPAAPLTRSTVARYLNDQDPVPPLEDPEITSYRPRLQLDFVGPAVGVGVSSLGYGFGGDVTAYFSDTLGEREVGVSLFGGTGTLDEFGGQAYYLNQGSRLHWGAGAGHIPYITAFTTAGTGVIEIDGEQRQATIIEQRRQTITQDQVQLITQYPFSTTRRFEANAGFLRLGFEDELRRVVVVGNEVVDRSETDLASLPSLQLYQASFAFVGDNSYFGFTSPVRGYRYRFEVEPTFGDLEFQSLTLDYRRYFFRRPVTLAFRGLHVGRYGTDAESGRISPFYVGRQTLVRGYEIDDIDGSECTVVPDQPDACPEFDRLIGSRIGVLNLELRFPLLGTEGFGVFQTRFLPIELSLFTDAGVAWTEDSRPELRYDPDSIERVPVVSAGVAARVLLGGFAVLQFYYAKPFHQQGEDWVTGFLVSPGW
ncbi:MAG TPA: BamA/TamA family outer membrane protein [Thermoanaerobaculia bacterium]